MGPMHQSPLGVDQAGRIRFINPAAAQLLGVEADRLAGQAHHPVILADSEGCPICACLERGERQKVAGDHPAANGNVCGEVRGGL